MLGNRPDPAVLAEADWDLVILGGGITGAGLLLEASRLDLKVLLVEQRDFAWGTSSRSSKMVHGGLRYLAQGDFRLTRHSLLERERLIRDLPELVVRETYLFPVRKGQWPGRWAMKAVLWLYDFLAGISDHRWLNRRRLLERVPGLRDDGLRGAMAYTDSLTDDARLVLRTLHEASEEGGRACNYLKAGRIESDDEHFLVTVHDEAAGGDNHTLRARRVINATGAWADRLSGAEARVRPLRGSHLFIPRQRLPVDDCLTLLHPKDRRPVFIFPWQGTTCIGTTDLDHRQELDWEPRCSQQEVNYLLDLVNGQFPELRLTAGDIISTMAGVRPVIASGKGLDPSQERRDHAVWEHDGIITVSGGKLTTFRLIALDALKAAGLISDSVHQREQRTSAPLFRERKSPGGLGHPLHAWPEGKALVNQVDWILQQEMVVHLDDLMLRRTRVGNLRPEGGRAELDSLEPVCRDRLGWDAQRWQDERERYLDIVRRYYSLPGAEA